MFLHPNHAQEYVAKIMAMSDAHQKIVIKWE